MKTKADILKKKQQKAREQEAQVDTRHQELIEASQNIKTEVEKLAKVIGQPANVEIDVDGLIKEISKLGVISQEIKGLEKRLLSLQPKDQVKITNLSSVIKAVQDTKMKWPEWFNSKVFKDIHSELKTINKEISERIVKQDQKPSDFVPVRRVILMGNRLAFDDTLGGGGTTSGGASVQDALIQGNKVKVTVSDIIAASQSGSWTVAATQSGTWTLTTSDLADYKLNDYDDASSPEYYGYENADGNWYIKKDDGTSAVRYAKGSSAYATAWTNRASQTYAIFGTTF